MVNYTCICDAVTVLTATREFLCTCFIGLRHSVRYSTNGLLIKVEFCSHSVCLSCLLVMSNNYGKMADSIKMQFEMVDWLGPRNVVLNEVQMPSQ